MFVTWRWNAHWHKQWLFLMHTWHVPTVTLVFHPSPGWESLSVLLSPGFCLFLQFNWFGTVTGGVSPKTVSHACNCSFLREEYFHHNRSGVEARSDSFASKLSLAVFSGFTFCASSWEGSLNCLLTPVPPTHWRKIGNFLQASFEATGNWEIKRVRIKRDQPACWSESNAAHETTPGCNRCDLCISLRLL